MKIRKVTGETLPKALALLRQAFPGKIYKEKLVEKLHNNGCDISDWVCLHKGKAIAYLAFTNAYRGGEICGLHLGPVAVSPDFQRQGVGSELISFALRQKTIENQTLFVLGDFQFFNRFGFERCLDATSPLEKKGARLLFRGEKIEGKFTVGYEKEFTG